ncbi:MAG: immune inhibitor A domain-containing protein [Acidimicrobiales bacterium]
MSAVGLGLTSFGAFAPSVGAAPPPGSGVTAPPQTASDHELPNPPEAKRRELRATAIEQVLAGEATPQQRHGSTVVKVGETSERGRGSDRGHRDQYVELENEGTDRVFTLLVEFGDERHPEYPDQDTDPDTEGPARFDGPLHNEIPEPNRRVDNSTVWEPDYSQAYFDDLYFGTGRGVESLKTYYEKQSSGRYSVDGEASAWVKVPYNEARYGRSNGFPCDDVVCDNTWNLVEDGMNAWVADQAAAGLTPEQIAAELATYDVADRYGFDGDDNFNEPDGYIDHLQIVHSGGDQADGDPFQGEDAIWSHRWYAFVTDAGITGPPENPLGGAEVGDTGIWAGDYTINPENGGLSTIAHEYGHDLGLPDHYDTAGGDNGVEWWTLMAQSRLSGKGEAIGTRAGDLSAWDKLQLGWLDYEVVVAGQSRTLDLGPHEYNSAKPQAAIVVLPEKTVTFTYGDPFAGERMWWSGKGDDLVNSMSRDVDLSTATAAAIDLKARFDIEADFDYLYLQASTDGGTTWTSLDGTVDGEPFIRDGSDSPAISGSSEGAWLDVHADLPAGGPISFRFLYRTDGGVAPDGFFADDIVISADGTPVVTSDAESGGDEGWALDGFSSTTGTETGDFEHYYIASHRSFVSYDKYLQTGPYNFGFATTKPDFVEHFSYTPGLLVSYWDTSQGDNNTSEHPGQGLILPVDSHPRALYNLTGAPWRSRIQVYDAPFSVRAPKSFTLHVNGRRSYIRGQGAQPVFDDSRSYTDPAIPQAGVDVPDTNTRIRVLSVNGTSMKIRVGTG